MDQVSQKNFDDYLAAIQKRREGKATRTNARAPETAETRGFGPVDVAAAAHGANA